MGDPSGFGLRDQQMEMVVHQDVSVQRAAGGQQRLACQGGITLTTILVEQAGQSVGTSLHHGLRYAGSSSPGGRAMPAACLAQVRAVIGALQQTAPAHCATRASVTANRCPVAIALSSNFTVIANSGKKNSPEGLF
ncbi:MAG: hypothetical protein PF483_16015 [Halothiobacillus sp.]|jgi:hypothetical protein|nr:hypothetical protein [Halothiobacillus sp.]